MEITYNRFIRKPLYNSQHYFIYGEEIILRDELISLIKQYFKNKEFHNVVTLGITSFDNLIDEVTNLCAGSLFQEKSLIHIKHSEGKMPEAIKKLLEMGIFRNNSSVMLIVESSVSKLNKSTKFYKDIQDAFCILSCNKLDTNEEKLWLKRKLDFFDRDALRKFGANIHNNLNGNLIGQRNEARILSLLYKNNQEQLSNEVSVDLNFDIFEFEDSLVKKDFNKIDQIIITLKKNNAQPPPPIIWIISKVITACYAIKTASSSSVNFSKLGIWSNKKSYYMNMSNSLRVEDIIDLQERIIVLDQSVKGAIKLNAWDYLDTTIMFLKDNLLLTD